MSTKKYKIIVPKSDLEKQYERLFKITNKAIEEENYSLEQPPAYKIVQSVTTYGAYEEPV